MTYIIPKKDHSKLYIYEGSLLNFSIQKDMLTITINSVDYPDLPRIITKPDYLDWVTIKFKKFTYLKLDYDYNINTNSLISNLIELGEIKETDELLDYGGVIKFLGCECDLPIGFAIEIVCQEIELEILPKNFLAAGVSSL